MVGATFISSWNPDSFARMGNLEDGEYYITINHNTLVNPKPYGISEYQVDTPFFTGTHGRIATNPGS